LYAGSGRLVRSTELGEVFGVLQEDLHFTVAFEARRRLFVRAGVVGWRGKAIVIIGPNRDEATRLVAALIRGGAAYYSDTFAAFDPDGRAHPYPAPISLRGTAGDGQNNLPVEELGGRVGRKPLPVGLIVAMDYGPGAPWRSRALMPAQAVLTLLAHSMLPRSRPSFTLAVLARVAATARALKAKCGEAESAATALLGYLERDSERWVSMPFNLKGEVIL
jgi:hypothetical protein